ncbi:unnamed protein product [Heligmosomoides polygyrus]|uniref:SDR family oxidoreductase n=1 Tax=Heligmosomoides polygyrus TaxID=6339 RepID=A0A183FZ84_HELPZ|nr:unnamed protein product [Heligmosomoides polygyrus]
MACKVPEKFFKPLKSAALPSDTMKGALALVTGGGTGLGKAIATMFAGLGAHVAIAARREDVLKATSLEIQKKTGGVCEGFVMDVKDPALVSKAMDNIVARFGKTPNILVNNAAGNFIMATERLSPNAVKTVVDIVLLGTMNVTMEVCRRAMKANQGCTVLSITTPYARHGGAFVVPSAISKAGVENMTRSLASEWAKYGMRFNGAFSRLSSGSVENMEAVAGSTIPVGRVGQPEELANLAAFVCSGYASWMNGAIIDFDGGQQHFNHSSSFGSHLHEMSSDDWQQIEDSIRQRTGKVKSKM